MDRTVTEPDEELRCKFLLLADYAYLEATGKMGICGVTDRITAVTAPVQMPYLWVAGVVEAPLGTLADVRIAMSAAGQSDGAPLAEARHRTKMHRSNRLNIAVKVGPLTFPTFGEYSLTCTVNDHLLATTTLKVHRIPPEAAIPSEGLNW
jgi:hypothetical protein